MGQETTLLPFEPFPLGRALARLRNLTQQLPSASVDSPPLPLVKICQVADSGRFPYYSRMAIDLLPQRARDTWRCITAPATIRKRR